MAVELIAECSSNHGGDLGLAKAFIQAYADAGADWIKFQSYQVQTLRPGDSQTAWLSQAELSDAAHEVLIETCQLAGVKFLTTIFHASRAPFLRSLGLDAIKVGSGEAMEPSIWKAVRGFPRVLLTNGLAPDLRQQLPWRLRRAEVLRGISYYPTPSWFALRHAMAPYVHEVGWSDHAPGIRVATAAIMAGAKIIEKHVSLREQRRPSRAFEATVAQFKELRAVAESEPGRHRGRWQAVPSIG